MLQNTDRIVADTINDVYPDVDYLLQPLSPSKELHKDHSHMDEKPKTCGLSCFHARIGKTYGALNIETMRNYVKPKKS